MFYSDLMTNNDYSHILYVKEINNLVPMQTLVNTDPFPSQPRKDRTVQAWLCIPMIHGTKEAEAGGALRIQGQLGLQSKCQAKSACTVTPCLKQNQQEHGSHTCTSVI